MTAASPDELAELALVARLGRGIQHRINNLMTVLLISSQHVQDMGGVTEGERREVQEILDRTVDQLGLLADLFVGTGSTVEVGRAMRAVASAVSGLNHQTTVTVEPMETSVIAAVEPMPLHRVLISACLLAHAAAPEGGDLRLGCADTGTKVLAWIRCTPRRGTQLRLLEEIDEEGARDLALVHRVADAAAMGIRVRGDRDTLDIQLELPRNER